jgi:hypothetical protein
LHNHGFRGLKYVASCESEKAEASVNQPILAAVVVDQTVPVRAAVIFETELLGRVVKVGATEKAAVFVVERDLGDRAR